MLNDSNWQISRPQSELAQRPTKDKDISITKRSKTKRSRRLNKKETPFYFTKGFFMVIGIFGVLLILLFLHSYTVSLNEDVRYLQSELNTINAEIDSKNGRLISNTDLKAIEVQARALGMTEAQPNQYIYETAAKKQKNISNSSVGLYDYISFFVQLRNEGLWPQAQ